MCAATKHGLCGDMGALEWEQQDLSESVKWWTKAVAVQVGSRYVTDWVPFLDLSYVAEQLGIRSACLKLRTWVDRIRSGQLRLNADAANELYSATGIQATTSMRLAIELLEKNYLTDRKG